VIACSASELATGFAGSAVAGLLQNARPVQWTRYPPTTQRPPDVTATGGGAHRQAQRGRRAPLEAALRRARRRLAAITSAAPARLRERSGSVCEQRRPGPPPSPTFPTAHLRSLHTQRRRTLGRAGCARRQPAGDGTTLPGSTAAVCW
jgi:hypothetical protein